LRLEKFSIDLPKGGGEAMSLKIFVLVMLATLWQWNVTSARPVNQQADFVFHPGGSKKARVYQIESSPSILNLIALAGGLSENHGRTAFIIRRSTSPSPATASDVVIGAEYRLITIDITGLLKGEFHNNELLTAGDILNIPPSEVFFLTGYSNGLRVFPLREGMKLSQAIPVTNGVSARIHEVVILRDNAATGKREEMKVDLGKVTSGAAIDVLIEANDIIVLPNSNTGFHTEAAGCSSEASSGSMSERTSLHVSVA
jgi:protein involved in polysaccharide export with SLBB domain